MAKARRCVATLLLFCLLPFAPVNADFLSDLDIKRGKVGIQAVEKRDAKALRRTISNIDDPLLAKVMHWFLYTEAPKGSTFEEINDFIQANPDWPRMAKMLKHTEEAMQPDMPSAEVLAWFDARKPTSTQGWVRFGAALLEQGQKDEAVTVLRKAWVDGKFTKSQEKQFYKRFRRYLTKADHEDRLDRLLWEGQYWPSRRMLWKVNEDLRLLAEARFLLRQMKGNVDTAVSKVPKHLKNDPGLIYERLRWRRRKGKDTSARELLVNLPENLP
ncbi:MAG: lytic transglycosylase domain-containing protein, partial [Rhodospirillales bacterium]|nr:lytic transglycosylase domain-containing protein [Rhodospirillales bacterium]